MASKLLNLIALSSLAVLVSTFGPTPVAALSTNHDVLRRHAAHDVIAKQKKRASNSKRCKTRSSTVAATSTSSVAAQTLAASVAPTTAAATKKAAATTSSSHKSTSTAASSSGGTGASSNGKVGLAWPNGFMDTLPQWSTDKTNMLYTWSPNCPSNTKSAGFHCVPQLWGWNQVDEFAKTVVEGYSDIVLGMNEPNEAGQSNMSPESGAQLWMQYIQPLASKGYKLISPATSSSPAGKVWMQNFFKACKDCTFDAVAVHWYDVSPQAFIDYVTDFHTTFGKPIWVTEWACQNFNGGAQCTQDEVYGMMSTVTKFMQETSWVEQYFAFGAMHQMQGVNSDNQLMSSSGAPSSLGYYYINANN